MVPGPVAFGTTGTPHGRFANCSRDPLNHMTLSIVVHALLETGPDRGIMLVIFVGGM